MSYSKLKLIQYGDLLKRHFGEKLNHSESVILSYLFYKVKTNNDLDKFINTDDADISKYFENRYFREYYEETTKDLSQDVFLFSSIIKNTDADVLKEYLNNRIKEYNFYSNRNNGKKTLEDLLERIIDLKSGDNFLYCYDNSFELLNRLVVNKNSNVTVLVIDNETRHSDNSIENYIYIKIYLELNAENVNVIYKKSINETFDKIYIDTFPSVFTNTDNVETLNRKNLNEGGTAVRLMLDRLLDTNDEDEKRKREQDLTDGILKSVVSIPKNISTCGRGLMGNSTIVIYSKEKKHSACNFVDAYSECENDNRGCWLTDNNIDKIVNAIENESSSISKLITYDVIRNNDTAFSPYYYIKNDGNLKNAVELGNIAKIFRGNDSVRIRIGRQDNELTDNKYTYKSLAASDIDEENIDYNNLPTISIEKNIDNFTLKSGDILINKNGTRLRSYLYDSDINKNVVPDGNVIVIRPDNTKIDSVYLKTFLDSEDGKAALLNIAQSGAIIRSINTGRLSKISVPCPPIENQEEFAKKYLEKKEIISKMNNEIKDLCSSYFHK